MSFHVVGLSWVRRVAAILIALTVGAFSAAHAEVLIIKAENADIEAGDVLDAGVEIDLVEGAFIVLLYEDGAHEIIRGPKSYTILTDDRNKNEQAPLSLGILSEIFLKLRNEQRLGAVRSADTCSEDAAQADWHHVASSWENGDRACALELLDRRLSMIQVDRQVDRDASSD